jgi:hypothetical protein
MGRREKDSLYVPMPAVLASQFYEAIKPTVEFVDIVCGASKAILIYIHSYVLISLGALNI